MGEVATLNNKEPAGKSPLMAGGSVNAIIPQSMEDAYRIAQAVHLAEMAPKDMKSPEACLIAIMHGLEIGLTPMNSLQRIAVINGRPTIWGDAAMGLVRASGLCANVRETISGDGDQMIATCSVQRRDQTDSIIGTFSVEDAKLAGLWNKTGPWKQYPKRMLQMRARGFALRDGFADVLGGLYLREEIEDAADNAPTPPPIQRDVIDLEPAPDSPAKSPVIANTPNISSATADTAPPSVGDPIEEGTADDDLRTPAELKEEFELLISGEEDADTINQLTNEWCKRPALAFPGDKADIQNIAIARIGEIA